MRKAFFTTCAALSPLIFAAPLRAFSFSIAPSTAAPAAVSVDKAWTDAAWYLAGHAPQTEAFQPLADPAWKTYSDALQKQWAKLDASRHKDAEAWRAAELVPALGSPRTVFYPFSGPDALNALLFFPDAERIVLCSIEGAGDAQNLAALPAAERRAYLKEIRDSLDDVFAHYYFVSVNVREELKAKYLKGTETLLLLFLGRIKSRIVSVEDVGLDAQGNLSAASAGGKGLKGTRIVYRREGSDKPQTLDYVSADLSNDALRKHPELFAHLTREAPFVTFLKSASFLMQLDAFSDVRGFILGNSRGILQDDSGVPYRFFAPADWTLTLYGQYGGPRAGWENRGVQKDLQQAYAAPNAARPLPFKFGYHWEQKRESCVQIAVRKTAPPK